MRGIEGGRAIVLWLLLAAGVSQVGQALWIKAKAHLAQHLIARAWSESVAAGGVPVKPWSWADTWPVARLLVPSQEVDLYVLAGAGGHALAFGPGHEPASAAPGDDGLSVIGGHRDTHFAFLRDLRPGTLISLQLPGGGERAYRVEGAHIVDADKEHLPLGPNQPSQLLLVTCYPFDAVVAGGPLRYVISARPLPPGDLVAM